MGLGDDSEPPACADNSEMKRLFPPPFVISSSCCCCGVYTFVCCSISSLEQSEFIKWLRLSAETTPRIDWGKIRRGKNCEEKRRGTPWVIWPVVDAARLVSFNVLHCSIGGLETWPQSEKTFRYLKTSAPPPLPRPSGQHLRLEC